MRKLLVIIFCLLLITSANADEFTTHYRLIIPEEGSRDWIEKLSNDIITIDSVMYAVSQDAGSIATQVKTEYLEATTGRIEDLSCDTLSVDTSIGGTPIFSGATTFNGTTAFNEDATFNENIYMLDGEKVLIISPAVSMDSTVAISGDVHNYGNTRIAGTVSLDSSLAVSGDTSLYDDVNLIGSTTDLNVAGAVSIDTTTTIAGVTTISPDASTANYGNATLIVSKGDTGDANTSLIGIVAEAASNGLSDGYGIRAIGQVSGNRTGAGVFARGEVTAAADTGEARAVIAQADIAHTGADNVAVWAQATNASNSGENFSFKGVNGILSNTDEARFADAVFISGDANLYTPNFPNSTTDVGAGLIVGRVPIVSADGTTAYLRLYAD